MTLHVYTARLSPTLRDPDALDVTRAGAERLQRRGLPAPSSPFAPSWGLLQAARFGWIEWGDYIERYTAQMRESYRAWRPAWDALLARSRVVLACVCAPDDDGVLRCHRRVLATILGHCGAQAHGELEPHEATLALPFEAAS